jgi:hypothetical protein
VPLGPFWPGAKNLAPTGIFLVFRFFSYYYCAIVLDAVCSEFRTNVMLLLANLYGTGNDQDR